MTQPRLLDTSEVRDILGLTSRQVARMVNAGELPSVEVRPGERRIPYHLLLEWIQTRTHDPDDMLISLGQAAEVLGVNVGILERMCLSGILPHRQIETGERLVLRSRVCRLLRQINEAEQEAIR